ncbi:carbamoyltransferase C-terminal domain-containing protein [Fundidesulfovibrio butyratiphilus]
MVYIGINEGINASVAVCDAGRMVYALQEERLSREKNHMGFPHLALDAAMDFCGLKADDVRGVCLSNRHSPDVTLEDFKRQYAEAAKDCTSLVRDGNVETLCYLAYSHLGPGLRGKVKNTLLKGKFAKRNRTMEGHLAAHGLGQVPTLRAEHHFNHAAAAYYGLCRDFSKPYVVLTLDGGGDDSCSHVYLARDGKLTLLAKTPSGHSLGQIYSAVTYFMGMTPHEHEYKLMGLAPYPDPKHSDWIANTFRSYLDLDPKNPMLFRRKIAEPTHRLMGRLRRDFVRVRFDNLAAGLQAFAEDLLARWARAVVSATGVGRVLAAGGVFMNVKANKRIAELGEVASFEVFPSCGDETLPFGAAWAAQAEADPSTLGNMRLDHLYLGPEAGADLPQALKRFAGTITAERLDDPEDAVAGLLARGRIVARCSGRMEFGARALGNRSILANPSDLGVVQVINRMIKQRDFWMPFAPAMTRESAERYVAIPESLPKDTISPFMMQTFDTTDLRPHFMAGVHNADRTARAQIVTEKSNARFHKLIERFGQLTGQSVVLNTSFNLHGYPIVTGAVDAVDVLLRSGLDCVVVDDTLIRKTAGTA